MAPKQESSTETEQQPLSAVQHAALGRSRRKAGVSISGPRMNAQGVRVMPDGHISPQTANVLIAAGLGLVVEGTLRITKAGEREFARVRPPDPDVFLRRRDGLTTRMDLREPDEPATMDPPHPEWRLRAEAHRKLSRQDLDAARLSGLDHPEERALELRRMAAEQGRDVASEVKRVELTRKAHVRAVRALERKVTTEEAA